MENSKLTEKQIKQISDTDDSKKSLIFCKQTGNFSSFINILNHLGKTNKLSIVYELKLDNIFFANKTAFGDYLDNSELLGSIQRMHNLWYLTIINANLNNLGKIKTFINNYLRFFNNLKSLNLSDNKLDFASLQCLLNFIISDGVPNLEQLTLDQVCDAHTLRKARPLLDRLRSKPKLGWNISSIEDLKIQGCGIASVEGCGIARGDNINYFSFKEAKAKPIANNSKSLDNSDKVINATADKDANKQCCLM